MVVYCKKKIKIKLSEILLRTLTAEMTVASGEWNWGVLVVFRQ